MPLELPGWIHVYSGKVRDLYVPSSGGHGDSGTSGGQEVMPSMGREVTGGCSDRSKPTTSGPSTISDPSTGGNDSSTVLVVASDRISAYDHVLATEIPDKGRVLTQLSLWWFDQLGGIPNHVVAADAAGGVPAAVQGRAMICRKLEMFPVECIARGYLTGSGLLEYRQSQTVCDVPLPAGLVDGSRLEEAIFTPSAKAEVGEHDENIDFGAVVSTVGADAAAELRSLTLEIYRRAEAIARERGIILADTKVEFGVDPATGQITLGDEVLTPDSSRFWDAATWEPGKAQPSFDKQYVRDWLTSKASGWDKSSDTPPPALPDDVVERTRARYIEAYERLTGHTFA